MKMHEFYRAFSYDPVTMPESNNAHFIYDVSSVDAYLEKQIQQGKIHFAIMLGGTVIGDVYLKNLNYIERVCTMVIHMVNDTYKGQGYGTQAEKLILAYAFQELKMQVVYADTLVKNERSRHVLEKVGFKQIRRDDQRFYYEYHKCNWNRA